MNNGGNLRAAQPAKWVPMSEEHRKALEGGGMKPEDYGVLEVPVAGLSIGYGETPGGPVVVLAPQAPIDLRDFVKPLSKLALGSRPDEAVGRYVVGDVGVVLQSVRVQFVVRRAGVSPAVQARDVVEAVPAQLGANGIPDSAAESPEKSAFPDFSGLFEGR